jgi:HEAT repeat protein
LAQSILQRDDAELREKALANLATMLAPDSSDKVKGLSALRKALPARFDRAPFRPLVAALLKSNEDSARMLALQCLPGLEPDAAVLNEVIPLADDPSPQVRASVASALVQVGKGQHGDKVIPALMKLLQDSDSKVVEQSIRSMWGQYSSPEFDELLIDLSRKPPHHHNVVYFGLSTMRTKSIAVCRRLVEELADPDWNNSGRAAWGLAHGVADEAKPLVEEGLLSALPEETNPYTRREEFRALKQVATEKSRPYLQSVVDSKLESDEAKQAARQILEGLDG